MVLDFPSRQHNDRLWESVLLVLEDCTMPLHRWFVLPVLVASCLLAPFGSLRADWCAVAYSPRTGGHGIATGHSSEADAFAAARQAAGNHSDTIVATCAGGGTCVIVTNNRGGSAYAAADTFSEAYARARNICTNGILRKWVTSSP